MDDGACRVYTGPQDDCGDEDLARVLRGKTIAVVGLSSDPEKISHRVADYLVRHGYDVIPVNPFHETIMGRPSYPSVRHIPVPVDIVNVFRRPEEVEPVVEDAIAAGAQSVWMQLQVVNEAAYRRAREAGLCAVMNRCIQVEHRRLMAPG